MPVMAELQHHVWTLADLHALPNDTHPRSYEIVDGALLVSPTPNVRHEVVLALVRSILERAGASDFLIFTTAAVDLHPSYRVPDLTVVSSALTTSRADRVMPAEVRLAVEVESPSSITDDRITKPAQYAAYGIPLYLRVETEPAVTVTVYDLAAGASVYTELGTWGPGETVHLEKPFAVDIPVDAITP